MIGYGTAHRLRDHRMERRELSRRLARFEDYDRRARGIGQAGCGCGCDGKRKATIPAVEARASFCSGSVCLEVRSGKRWIKALAHRYGVWSSSICNDTSECFREIVRAGAFRPALSRPGLDVAVTIMHEPSLTLARYPDDPDVRVWEDQVGLHFELPVPDNALGRRTIAQMEDGQLRGASFVMADVEAEWSIAEDGELLRRVLKVGELKDVAIVNVPAYSFGPPEPVEVVA